MKQLGQFWKLINEPPLNSQPTAVQTDPLFSLMKNYFVRPYLGNMILIIILSGLTATVNKFVYAWAGRYIADDIVEIHLLSQDSTSDRNVDPTQINENRRFALDNQEMRSSWTERLDSKPGKSVSEKFRLLGWLSLLLLAVILADHVGLWILQQRMIYVGQKVQFHLRHRVYQKLLSLPMSYHDGKSIGSQMTHLFSDVSGIQNASLQLFRQIPMHTVSMAIGLTIMFCIDVHLTLLVLLALPAYAVCYRWFHRRLKTTHENLRQREGRLNGHIANRISNFYLVKAFVRETFEALDFLRKGRLIVRDTLAASLLGTCFTVVCGIISGVCMVAVLWLGTLQVRSGEMTLGTLLLFYTSAGYMFAPVASLTALAGMFHRLCALSQKVMRVLDEPITLNDPAEPLAPIKKAPEIRFENVSMTYSQTHRPALSDISFSVPPGKTLCVMGASGSGKSTLAKLACRIYDPTCGRVLLDNKDIRNFKISELHKTAGLVTQEPVIFDGTIAENIRYGTDRCTPNQIVTAAQFAQIHEYIVRLPQQYETITRERGLTLSGGQKQRVNLARTLLYDPKVLVLDDCTSALDAETEAKLIESFATVLKGRTSILVSHRISIAMHCDLVMVLGEGTIMELGPPRKLLENGRTFSELYHQQVHRTEMKTSSIVGIVAGQ